ncbi:tetraspanin-33-like isoform X5 [Rhipicephalus microplus]|uniref:tetraspanin-33-like isoform X5 n=1 Tax=Rhipicephalus microplus TaxID=6941 RepID=UPI003F6B3795
MVLSLGVFIVASIGFIGALRENIELLDLYTTLQGSFITTEAVFIVMLFFLPIIGREFVISHITTEFIVHYRDKLDYQRVRAFRKRKKNEIDYVQSSLHCCGMTDNSYRDWNANPYFNCSPTNPSAERCSVPPSCCRITEVPDIVDYNSGTGAHEAEPVKASKSGAPESAGASADGDVYVTTLCGRGVMNLKEQDAWKVVYRGQKRMKLKEAATERPSPQDLPLVASKEARRQRHRRRYLDARPPWKQLSNQIASPAAASSL